MAFNDAVIDSWIEVVFEYGILKGDGVRGEKGQGENY